VPNRGFITKKVIIGKKRPLTEGFDDISLKSITTYE
jgi:hypothetical protein